jgi:cellulose synthase/poly-beta-1,6-N-acetylglucosamine synthase-like glycosyltransferase
VSTAGLIVFEALFAYFLTAALGSVFLLVASLRAYRANVLDARSTDHGILARSALTMPISVIIPAHDEERAITDAVWSAVRSEHPEFEVIVVDDGSSDRTLQVLADEFELEATDVFRPSPLSTRPVRRVYRSRRCPMLWVIEKGRGGKADACNAGVNLARFRYIMMTDADCVLHPEALLRIARVVGRDPGRIVVAGGQLAVGNGLLIRRGRVHSRTLPRGLLLRFQLLEYLSVFVLNRPGWSLLNATPVVSGGFGVWRRDAVVEVGGLSSEVTHEDIELTWRLHESFHRRRIPYRMAHVPDALVWTEAPSRWRDIYRQRKRWQRVVYEVVWRYRRMFLNPRYGSAGLLGMPYLVLFETLGPLVEAGAWVLFVVLAIQGEISLWLAVAFLAFSFGLTALVRIASLVADRDVGLNDAPRRSLVALSLTALLEQVLYRPPILAARLVALCEALAGRRTWERVARAEREIPAAHGSSA